MNKYSDFFKTLYDETQPVGNLGRGTHYSVLRSVIWHDSLQKPLSKALYHDLAVIWDEDHDIRVIKVIEKLYFSNLLVPISIIGERKGYLSVVISDIVYNQFTDSDFDSYKDSVEFVVGTVSESYGDYWSTEVSVKTSDTLINDNSQKVSLYLQTINMLWNLGVKCIFN